MSDEKKKAVVSKYTCTAIVKDKDGNVVKIVSSKPKEVKKDG